MEVLRGARAQGLTPRLAQELHHLRVDISEEAAHEGLDPVAFMEKKWKGMEMPGSLKRLPLSETPRVKENLEVRDPNYCSFVLEDGGFPCAFPVFLLLSPIQNRGGASVCTTRDNDLPNVVCVCPMNGMEGGHGLVFGTPFLCALCCAHHTGGGMFPAGGGTADVQPNGSPEEGAMEEGGEKGAGSKGAERGNAMRSA